jgi:hypothetical protein
MLTPSLPSWQGVPGDAERTVADVDGWASSAAMTALLRAFGAELPPLSGDPLLERLEAFSALHWDFRGGRERNLAAQADLTDDQQRAVFELAPALGLAGHPGPRRRDYDTILMTGGMIRAGIVKPRFVRELIDSGVDARTLVFAGGFRPFAGDELDLAAVFGVRGDNEVNAMVRGMELAFGPLGQPVVSEHIGSTPSASWRVCEWEARGRMLVVLAAASSDPLRRRANTADTYHAWAQRQATGSVLMVTTPIYVPYQAAAAVEVLGVGHGLAVETVGVSATASDLGEYSQQFLPHHHLQEIRSAIRGMRSLRAALVAGESRGHAPGGP